MADMVAKEETAAMEALPEMAEMVEMADQLELVVLAEKSLPLTFLDWTRKFGKTVQKEDMVTIALAIKQAMV